MSTHTICKSFEIFTLYSKVTQNQNNKSKLEGRESDAMQNIPTILHFTDVTYEAKAPISSLIGQYLYYAENVRGLSPETLKSRLIYLRQFHEYLVISKKTNLAKITNIDLDTYWVDMSKRISIHTGRQITTGTVNTSKRAVKGFLRWCNEYLEIELKAKIGEIREQRLDDKFPNILRHDDILKVIRNITNKQDRLMISVMYESGMRISELKAMKLEHIRGNRTLDVVGKGKRHRITYLTPKLVKEIREWMESKGWNDGYVFRPEQHGDGIRGYDNADTIRNRIKRWFKTILGIIMHPHQLRHAFALRLLHSGVDLRSIQKLLGHRKIETTMAYLGIDDEYLEMVYSTAYMESVYFAHSA